MSFLLTTSAVEPAQLRAEEWRSRLALPYAHGAHVRAAAGELPELARELQAIGGPRTHVTVSTETPPDAGHVELLLAAGVDSVQLARPERDAGELWWPSMIAFLREAVSHGLPVSWQPPLSAGWDDGLDVSLLVHLPPPTIGDGAGRAATDWSHRHAPGLCRWRQGTGFVVVLDERDGAASQTVIDDPVLTGAFGALHEPTRLAELGRRSRAAAGELIEAGFVLDLNGIAVTLPYRLRHWPVPNTSY
ncbi:MAG TPA: DUF5825 family protein [Jatrophihabitans sp.]|nr:DUF5825 family protein [Jatrophihabitans sp.]